MDDDFTRQLEAAEQQLDNHASEPASEAKQLIQNLKATWAKIRRYERESEEGGAE